MLARLFEHLEWADANARDAVATLPRGAPEAASALRIFAHVVGADHVWLARLRGVPAELPVWPQLDLELATELATRGAGELRRYVADVMERGELAREIEYTNSAGQHFRGRIDDILTHVALHGAYHRGQIAMLVRQGGGEPASTDYIAFVRGVPAARTILTPP
jgi:uncharacterized damage-inducible protein DinB